MSGNAPFILIVTEGVHDVAAISRVLKLKGFRELQMRGEIPDNLRSLIPSKYPLREDGRLSHLVPHPSFLKRGGALAVVSNANGKTEIGRNLLSLLSVLSTEALSELAGVAVVVDMDMGSVEENRMELLAQMREPDLGSSIELESALTGTLTKEGFVYPFLLFLWPDSRTQGTLETLLIAGAEQEYPDLLHDARVYIEAAKQRCPKNLSGFNDSKATVGVISNVFCPGKPNQVSIRENDWLTEESLRSIPSHIAFSAFIDSLCAMLQTDRDTGSS